MSLEILNNPQVGNSLLSFPEKNNSFLAKPPSPVLKTPQDMKQLTSQQIANTYYDGKPVASGKGFKIYSDEPKLEGTIEEVVLYKSRFSKRIGDIDVVLFASKNGAFLLQRYIGALPQSNELILFLEIDDQYNRHTVMRAVAGANLTNPDKEEFADILSFARKKEVTISPDALKELIEKGIYKNKISFIHWFLGLKDASIGEIFNSLKMEILQEADEFFTGIANGISTLKVSENGWNPTPKEGEYEPALIPEAFHKEIKKFYEHSETPNNPYTGLEGQKTVNTKIANTMFEKLDGVKNEFYNHLNTAEKYFPSFIFRKVKRMLSRFFGQIDQVKKYLAEPITGLQHLVYRSFQVSNAFLCGIYNSLVDVIAGIFAIIGLIFKAVAGMENVNNNKVAYGEMFLELMEDFVEGILKFDYVDFFVQCIKFQLKTIVKMAKWMNEKTSIAFESIAYYYGYIVGIIIDIILETLLTGGTAAVAKLAGFMEKSLGKMCQAITKSINFGKNMLDNVISFFSMLLREFKKGPKELFAKLEKWLDEIFGYGQKVGDNALTEAQKNAKKIQSERARKIEIKNRRAEIKKADAERKRRQKKFWKDGYDPDPTFSIWGSGKLSHPELWKSIMDDLVSKGCKIKTGEKNLTYGASAVKGESGVLSLTNDASITALQHEAKHFLDDLAKGFPSNSYYMQNPKEFWKMEYDAYMVEIKMLRENKEFDTAKKLLENALEEKKRIEDFYNVKL